MPTHRTRIKICGVTTPDAARAATDNGADAIGLVFVPGSPRVIDPAKAWNIVRTLPPFVASVGLFRNATVDQYIETERQCPTDFGQLHGDEPEEVVQQCGPRVIKAIRFDAATIKDDLARWSAIEEVDAVMVDGGAGGEGTAFDWDALARAGHACSKPLFLAGGLTPENVGEAVRTVRPFAVDVSSGVESSPGVKDASKIEAFCAAVRAADHQ
jgi:phosphoribosylanthranilate isomerase